MYKINKNQSIFNEDFNFNLDLQNPTQSTVNQLNWQSLIPRLKSIDEELSNQLTQSLENFCKILADLNFIDSINSIFNQPNSTEYENKQFN